MASCIVMILFLVTILSCVSGALSLLEKSADEANMTFGSVLLDGPDVSAIMPNDQGVVADDSKSTGCYDWQGKFVSVGEKYVPHKSDMCTQCICEKYFPIRCVSVACSPPQSCANPELVKGACCEYVCINDGVSTGENSTENGSNNKKDEGESITNLSLRLIASTVTSFLVLALLLFMVHRLRQRRLMLAMRPYLSSPGFEARARQVHSDDTDSEPYMPDAYISVECPPYTDPPPPYSPPKPPQIMPGEQPPPYEEINQNGDSNCNSASENRNENTGGNYPNRNGPPAPAAATTTVHEVVTNIRNGGGGRVASVQNEMTFHPNAQSRAHESRHQRSASGPIRAPNSLPAYASTDVVDGLGVVISPGSELVSYTPYNDGWTMWLGDIPMTSAEVRHSGESTRNRNSAPVRDRPRSLGNPNTSRVQAMPTITAFQRFSNIFKRDSWKVRNRRRNGRPSSEYNTPPHYATVPRNETASDTLANHHQFYDSSRERNSTRPHRTRFPDRMCLSYDSAQATYTLGPMSPSTSSSNSSSSTEPSRQHYTTSPSTTTPAPSSNSNSISPQSVACNSYDNVLSSQRMQLHHELRQQIAPLQPPLPQQTSHQESLLLSPASTTWNEGNLGLTQSSTTASISGFPGHNPLSQGNQQARTQGANHLVNVFGNDTNGAHAVHPAASHRLSSRSSFGSPDAKGQQSLASFIRSNPSATITDIQEHMSERGIIPSQPLGDTISESLQAAAHSNREPSPEMLPKCFPTFPVRSSSRLPGCHESIQQHSSEQSISTSSSSPSPSPSPPVVASAAGAMRRSLSAVSQASMFSVCSETGEKKMRSTVGGSEDDARILSADSHYPEYHTLPMSRLSGSKPELQHFPACVSHTRSKSDADGTSRDASETSRTEPFNRASSPELRQQTQAAAALSTPAAATSAQPSSPPPAKPFIPPSLALADVPAAQNKDTLGTGEEKNYNLNTVQTDKSLLLQKDLPPPVYEDVRMSQSVNIPPLTSLSSKTATSNTLRDNHGHAHANMDELETVQKPEKSSDVVKKQKKKRTKDRNSSSPQLLHLTKTKHTSPKHLRVHLTDRKKPEHLSEEKDCKLKLSRPIDKKLRLQSVVSKQPVRFSDSHGVNKMMTRSAPDAPMMYGNADVYRGGGESFAPMMGHPLQQPLFPPYLDPWVHQDHEDFHDHNFGPRLGLNDLNQPPNHLKPSDCGVTVFPVCGTSALAVSKFQEINSHNRKKPGQRRQVAGDKLGYVPSPSRHKTRPKSLTAAVDNEKREALPRPFAGNIDNVVAGKGARSGFGHDLNFEDQNGISDWYDVHEGDFTHKRTNLSHDVQHLVNSGVFKNMVKSDGPAEAACGANKAAGTIHPSSKSGLSNELSFVSRTTARPKKRQSMSATGTFTQQNLGVVSPKQNEGDSSVMGREVRVEKLVHQSDSRHDRMAISDDNSEATSYV